MLSLSYEGNFGSLSNLVGFYRSRYTEDGVIKTILATDFEPTNARAAFPCFDEPALKATFTIAIEHPTNSIALSNWPVDSENSIGNGRKKTSFKTTEKMSTYLAAWVVAPDDYSFVEGKTKNGTPVRIYGRSSAGRNKLLDFALDVAIQVTDYFENTYFQISDAVPPKIDMIALPQYPNGAMENWGLVTYRETTLFFSENSNSLANKQNVAATIAHELAHFWFGNLVTPSWWNDLWLNEAMATFLQYKSIQTLYEEWDLADQFISDKLVPVMFDDGFEASQPVYLPVNDPNEITNLFSSITYDKGAAVLFMLESTVGFDNFRDGLRNYLNSNKFGSGNAADFYSTLTLPSEMAGVTVKEYMDTWLLQINYPEVEIDLDNNQDSSVSVVNFIQERFSLSIFNENELIDIPLVSPFNYTWKIYLQCYAFGDTSNNLDGTLEPFNFYLGSKEGSKKLDKKYSWVKCNKDFKGFYLSSYSNFKGLVEVFNNKPGIFSIGDRASFLNDEFSKAYQGSDNYIQATNLASYLESYEIDYVPWKTYIWHINKILQIVDHRPSFKDIRDYNLFLTAKLRKNSNITSDTGSHSQRLLRIQIIEFLCRLHEASCLKYTDERFSSIPPEYFREPENSDYINSVSPNYRRIVYKYHIQNTFDYSDFFKVNDLYLSTNDPFERANSFVSLSSTRLSWAIDFLLYELIRDNSRIGAQDFFDILSWIGRNPTGRHQVWAFVREYWDAITAKFGNGKAFARAVKSICESFDNKFLLDEVLEVFRAKEPGAGYIIRRQTVDIILNNVFWTSREQEIVEAFFVGEKEQIA